VNEPMEHMTFEPSAIAFVYQRLTGGPQGPRPDRGGV
jgi:hypothetical protein